jgi:hypothetical protein
MRQAFTFAFLLFVLSLPCRPAAADAVLSLDGKTEILSYSLFLKSGPDIRRGYAVLQITVPDKSEESEKDDPGGVQFSRLVRAGASLEGISSLIFGTLRAKNGDSSLALSPLSLKISRQTLSSASSGRIIGGENEFRFRGEEGTEEIRIQSRAKALYEDSLFIRVREPFEPLAVTGLYPILVGLEPFERDGEVPAWHVASVVREARTFSRTVPAGDFAVRRVVVQFNTERGSRQYTYFVEAAPPRRVVSWQIESNSLSGAHLSETAELVGSERVTKSLLDFQEGNDLRRRLEIPPQ